MCLQLSQCVTKLHFSHFLLSVLYEDKNNIYCIYRHSKSLLYLYILLCLFGCLMTTSYSMTKCDLPRISHEDEQISLLIIYESGAGIMCQEISIQNKPKIMHHDVNQRLQSGVGH